jgi:peptidoglycan/LPS O-acetylase OafA/YrhL
MSHSNWFDHARLFAALLVLYSHHFALWGRHEPSLLGLSLGAIGVAIFFAISGYLVSKSLQADLNPLRFLYRRALRIMPGLTVNTLFCMLVIGVWLTPLALPDYFRHPQFIDYLYNLLFQPRFALPGVFAQAPYPYAVNGSLWTLPFEVLGYVVLAVAALLVGRQLRWFVPSALIAAALGAVLWTPSVPVVVLDNDLRHIPRFMAYFFVGASLAFWEHRIPRNRLLVLLLLSYALVEHFHFRQVVTVFLLPLLAVHLALRPLSPSLALRNDLSYGMYLYAFPVQQTVIAMAAIAGFWGTMGLALAITAALALLSWRFIERPALRLKPTRSTPLNRAH